MLRMCLWVTLTWLGCTCLASAAEMQLPGIPPQSLDKALQQLARASSLQFAYVGEITSGLATKGCPAGLSAGDALAKLLEGTGLSFEFINERTVRISSGANSTRAVAKPRPTVPHVPPGHAADETAHAARSDPVHEVLVVGSRSPIMRSNTESLMPVDVLGVDQLAGTGQADLTQMVNFLVPSFNSARQTIADGTDHIDPATLRGLGPDQALVLINGKRQHTTALVNVNSTVGRGSVGYDMNMIPAGAIERIEILRDGAAAQYGSDAIAGVINIVLKQGADLDSIASYISETSRGDGRTLVTSVNAGTPVGGAGGFLNGALQYSDRAPTDRSGPHNNTVYLPALPSARYFRALTPEESARKQLDDLLVEQRGFDRSAMLVGNASSRNYQLFFNSAVPVATGAKVFAFGGYSRRHGRSAGFYRYPNAELTRNLELYPDGYLPFIETDIDDLTLAFGATTQLAQCWQVELSNKFGMNSIEFAIDNSLNASLGVLSPLHFHGGELGFAQNTINLDVSRTLRDLVFVNSLNVAFGAEHRREHYRIGRGEAASWQDYNPPDTPPAQRLAPGAQVFNGFRPENEADAQRTNLGFYADFESDITQRLLLGVAARYENYSDFGASISGKLVGRLELFEGLGVRGGINKGYRAPSLHQKYYSAVSTQFITVDGMNQQRQISTLRNDSQIARQLGVPELEPEGSLSHSLGIAAKLAESLELTLDTYQIDIDDRIVISSRFSTSIPQLQPYFQGTNITETQFFTNAIDTRTRGIDAILTYKAARQNGHELAVNVAFNYNETRVSALNTPRQLEALGQALLNREERGRLEVNQPRDKLIVALNYASERAKLHLQVTRFGEITTIAPQDPAQDQTFSPKLVTDAAVNYQITDSLCMTVGANNVFDVYPDRVADPRLTNDGTVPYSRFATQFGFNGASYFASLELKF